MSGVRGGGDAFSCGCLGSVVSKTMAPWEIRACVKSSFDVRRRRVCDRLSGENIDSSQEVEAAMTYDTTTDMCVCVCVYRTELRIKT